jgi:DNA recombination protein RmuC
MESATLGLGVVIFLALGILAIQIYVSFFRKVEVKKDTEGLVLMQQQLQELSRTMREQMSESNRIVQEGSQTQFKESKELMQQINKDVNEQIRAIQESVGEKLLHVQRNVSEVSESSKQVFQVAEQLRELQDILKNPKQRGVLGEYYLETVLQNVLPPGSYEMQYKLGVAEDDGKDLIPDAVVFVKDKIIPIDSKFSLENYNRYSQSKDIAEKAQLGKLFLNDLKERIKETSKYIKPNYKTTDFAFMFIPHEGIYYDLLANPAAFGSEENLIQKAAGTYKVIIVSPTSFLAYLQTVLQGLKAMEIEEKAQDIIKNVNKLQVHWSKYEEYYKKMGKSLETTVSHYNTGYKELGKVDKDVMRITGETMDIEVLSIEKPQKEE